MAPNYASPYPFLGSWGDKQDRPTELDWPNGVGWLAGFESQYGVPDPALPLELYELCELPTLPKGKGNAMQLSRAIFSVNGNRGKTSSHQTNRLRPHPAAAPNREAQGKAELLLPLRVYACITHTNSTHILSHTPHNLTPTTANFSGGNAAPYPGKVQTPPSIHPQKSTSRQFWCALPISLSEFSSSNFPSLPANPHLGSSRASLIKLRLGISENGVVNQSCHVM
jgi:hypothetical protein